MKYYVDDIFFAMAPKIFDSNQFFEDWPSTDCRKRFDLNNSLYSIQEYKNKNEIDKTLIPYLRSKLVPEIEMMKPFLFYAIVRESITDLPYKFDYVSEDDNDFLLNFLYFTVLIHPTPIDLAYSARVLYKDEERTEIDRVLPNTHLGNGSQFIVGPVGSYKSHMTPDELRASYSLHELYKKNEENNNLNPKNLKLLINYYLSSFWVIWFEISLVIVVSALEALFNTTEKGKGGITRQFKNRISMVSKELKKERYLSKSVSVRKAEKIYNLRCDYTHRGEFNKNGKEYKKNYKYLESAREILSGTIRKCIKDPNFAKIFNSHKKIDKSWPV